jgi:hypothetical protein
LNELILKEAIEVELEILTYDDLFWEALLQILDGVGDALHKPAIANDDRLRKIALHALLNVMIWDEESSIGDVAAAVPEMIIQHAKPDDLDKIRKAVQHAQAERSKSPYRGYESSTFAEFLADLDAIDGADPEQIIENLIEQGMYRPALTRLLEMKKIEQAIALIEHHMLQPYERLEAAYALSAVGHTDEAVRLIEAIHGNKYSVQLSEWLIKQYIERADHASALKLLRLKMGQYPSPQLYEEIKKTALKVNQWETVRAAVLADLRDNHLTPVLARIHLLDGEWDSAWNVIESKPPKYQGYGYEQIDLEVARATRTTHPRRSIPVYLNYVRTYINHRSRDSYRTATGLLVEAREDLQAWQKQVEAIKTEFKQLPALKDEMRQAGL